MAHGQKRAFCIAKLIKFAGLAEVQETTNLFESAGRKRDGVGR
jgi:hypothetical protein